MLDMKEGRVMVNHFTYFVYIFSLKREREMLQWLLEGERGWRIRLYNSRKAMDAELADYYLPYVRRILYPSVLWKREKFSCFFSSGTGEQANVLYELPCKDFVNRTYKGIKIGISFNNGERFIQGEIYDIVLRLFKRGVGFLVFKTRIAGERPFVESLLELNSCFRILNCEEGRHHFPNIKIYLPGQRAFTSVRELIVFLTGGFASGEVDDLPGGRMLVYSYCCLSEESWEEGEQELFQRYKHVWQKNFYVPAAERIYTEETNYTPWKYSMYGFTMEGGVVLSCEKDIFNRDILPFYYGNYFFDLYLLSLYQRIRLMRFSRRLAETEILKSSKVMVARLREDILDFFNQYIFNQVSKYSIGNEIWRKWQNVLEIESMFDQVHQELAEMDDYLKSVRQERMDRAVAYATFLLIPVSVITGILGSNLVELQGLSIRNPWLWGITLGVYSVMFISYLWTRRGRDRSP